MCASSKHSFAECRLFHVKRGFTFQCRGCKQVRAFDFRSGKLRRKYDESRRAMEDMIASGQLKMDAMDLGKKSAVEKELEVTGAEVVLIARLRVSLHHGIHEPVWTQHWGSVLEVLCS